jgi:hypothetical protein
MSEGKKLGDYLLKADTFTSRNNYKRAVLRGQLSLVGVLVGVIYTFIDLFNHLYVSIPFYVLLILLCAVVFWINRRGDFFLANVIYLLLLASLIYVFADNDYNHTGVGAYFVVYALIALTLCGYDQIKLGLAFASLGLIGFFLAYYVDLPPIIKPVQYSETYVNISFMTNFIVTLLVAVALLFFSLNIKGVSKNPI